MDVTERFARLMARPEPDICLDEAALLIAAHAYPNLDVDAQLGRLDDLAQRCYAPTLDAVVEHLFVDEGFAGNRVAYHDPRNSFLNEVLDRRLGIPITLSVLTIEVGRRLGVPIAGVGMPGHFLLRDKVDPDLFVDPFAGGARLDQGGCEAAFRSLHGADAPFDPAYLEPAGTHSIIRRMLANLKGAYTRRGNRGALVWAVRLGLVVPGAPGGARRELVNALAANGQFDKAATELDALADNLRTAGADQHRYAATRLRAKLN